MLRFREAGGEELAEERLERGGGGDELVVGGGVVGFVADVFHKLFQSDLVFVGDEVWLDDEGGAVLEIDEAMWPIELEADFLRIHQVEQRDIMLAVAEVLEGFGKLFCVREEIREDDNEGALADFFRDDVERFDQAGFAGWLDLFDRAEKAFKVGGAA